MFKWLVLALGVLAMIGSLGAMGVGLRAMGELLLALVSMLGVALLVAWPFLRKAEREARPGESPSAGKAGPAGS